MLRWLWFCAFALMLCGCLESKAEFNAINLGKVNAIYENGALRIISIEPTPQSSLRDSTQRVESWQSIKNQKDNAPFVLFFFTTSCGVCKAQIPILQELATESASSGARIYAIVGNVPNAQKAWQYAQSNAISLPLFYESEAKRFFSQIVGGVKGVPAIVVFDKEGRVKERFIGLTPKSVLKSAM